MLRTQLGVPIRFRLDRVDLPFGRKNESMTGRKRENIFNESRWLRDRPEKQIRWHRRRRDSRWNAATGDQRSHFRRKIKVTVLDRVIERLDAEPVASHENSCR